EKREEKEKKKIDKKEINWCFLDNQTFLSSTKKEVIFNEIAWMGTENSSSDEWIELKNLTGNEIDLTGWQIQNKDQKLKIIFPEIKIPPYGFILLERTDDNSVPNIKGDLIYKGAIKNSNETLFLFDKNCNLKDKVKADPSWPAGDNLSFRTMERKKDLTWQTSKEIGGTPKKENSLGYIKTNYLIESTHPSQNNSKIYPKILISEVYIGSKNDPQDEFVELYNPNNKEVDLTGWYLQRKTKNAKSFSSYVSSKLFSSKTISKKGYFLIARENSSFKDLGNIITKNPLTSNNTLVLKNPNREIVDEINWKEIPLNKSYGRKWENGRYKDTNNCNLDFEIQKPTPKKRNLKETSFSSGGSTSASGSTILAVGGGQDKKKSTSKNKHPQINFCEIPSSLEPNHQIIFSEIAWAGSLENPSDEWIELQNNSQTSINLKNWQILGVNLKTNTPTIKFVFQKDLNLSPEEFILLERTDDNSIPEIPAEAIFTGSINNSDFALYLFNSQCQLSDFVVASSSWPAGDNKEKRSMERDLNLTWHSYFGSGTKLGPQTIFGTPKAKNSVIKEIQSSQKKEADQKESEANQKKDKANQEANQEEETNQKESDKATQQENTEYSHILKNVRILNFLKISEVLVKSTSTLSNNLQFIELYNSTSTAIDLKEVSLQYLGSKGKKIQRISRKNLGTIPGYGFYLIASTSTVFGKKADSTFLSGKKLSTQSSGGTIFLVATTTELGFSTSSPFILDKFAYGNGKIYPEGEAISSIQEGISWERKAFKNSTLENFSCWQNFGRSFDSQNNSFDFIFQNQPTPQNSKDPSQNPNDYFLPLPSPEEIKSNFSFSEEIESSVPFPILTLNLSWQVPKNFPFKDSITEIYYFSTSTELNLSSSTLFDFSKTNLSTTTATSTSIKIKSFNQYLYFGLKFIQPTCQKSSQIIWQKTFIPSFIKNAYFYQAKTRDSQKPNYFLELEFENKNWISDSQEYHSLILINLNQPPTLKNPLPFEGAFPKYPTNVDYFIAILLRKTTSSRIIIEGIKYPQRYYWQFDKTNLPQPDENDLTLRIPFDFDQNFSSSTYFTFSFYQRTPWYFNLLGFDTKKYFFGKIPQFFSPSQPKISLSLDKNLPSLVKISTTPSVDYDSLDENLFYQFNLTDNNSSSTFIFNLKKHLLTGPIYHHLQEGDLLNISLNVSDDF
ncbi:lamin tail domain-containing protein, partial [bacterium]|nr:lamin tail domain-containing protein [bacterium]